jgi:hypothetical protein
MLQQLLLVVVVERRAVMMLRSVMRSIGRVNRLHRLLLLPPHGVATAVA